MAAPRVDRRLAAILAADVVGYSCLMERDEDGTLDRLKAHRQEFIEPIWREQAAHRQAHGRRCSGRVRERVDAVRARSRSSRPWCGTSGSGRPSDPHPFRIGINLGDVVHEDGDIFGDGVNIAARLEAARRARRVCVSAAVYDQAGNSSCRWSSRRWAGSGSRTSPSWSRPGAWPDGDGGQ